jgi:hypothetical protein
MYPSKFRMLVKPMMMNHHKVPSCTNCKYLLTHRNVNYCRLFKYIFVPLDMEKDKFNWYVHTKHARSDPALCGPDGNYFKPIDLIK